MIAPITLEMALEHAVDISGDARGFDEEVCVVLAAAYKAASAALSYANEREASRHQGWAEAAGLALPGWPDALKPEPQHWELTAEQDATALEALLPAESKTTVDVDACELRLRDRTTT
jgi:hypothetical protein